MSEGEVQYAIGVDLGTTHSAVSYVDLDLSEGEEVALHVLTVPQLTSPGSIEGQGNFRTILASHRGGIIAPKYSFRPNMNGQLQ